MEERGVPREGYDLFQEGGKIGKITSGGFSPLLKTGIGMGYASPELEAGEEISVRIREQKKRAMVEEWPFFKGE